MLSNARQSVNIADKTGKRSAPVQSSGGTKNARSATTEILNPARKKKKTKLEKSGNKAVNFLNSDKWSGEVRPPHLMDDDVFNSRVCLIADHELDHNKGHDDQQ